jgi:hypothetical protein
MVKLIVKLITLHVLSSCFVTAQARDLILPNVTPLSSREGRVARIPEAGGFGWWLTTPATVEVANCFPPARRQEGVCGDHVNHDLQLSLL